MSVRVKGWPFRVRMALRISLCEDGEGECFFFDDFRKFFVQLSKSRGGKITAGNNFGEI
jgi:hypothetical protein